MLHIKRLDPSATTPEYQTEGAAAFDLYSSQLVSIGPGETNTVPTGWAFEIPEGYEVQIRPRSGVTLKTGLRVQLGTIDSDYRGEIKIIVQNTDEYRASVHFGERIAQGVLNKVPRAIFMQVPELSSSKRGTGGFGSTGT